MNWNELASELFPNGYDIKEDAKLLFGTAKVNKETVTVIGTCDNAEMNFSLGLGFSGCILKTIHEHPKRPIILLIDTQGQPIRIEDQNLGIHRVFAHIAKCIEFARIKKHPVIAIIFNEAYSAGFISTGLMSDVCYALPHTLIGVMKPSFMRNITHFSKEQLQKLEADNTLLSHDVKSLWVMGAIKEIWSEDIAQHLSEAIKNISTEDNRIDLGHARGGRSFPKYIVTDLFKI
jgi:malonate decarboxylase gamma subunit